MKNKKKDTYSYKGGLASDFFLKRAFAVFGHQFVASLLISACIFAVLMVIALLFGGLGLISVLLTSMFTG